MAPRTQSLTKPLGLRSLILLCCHSLTANALPHKLPNYDILSQLQRRASLSSSSVPIGIIVFIVACILAMTLAGLAFKTPLRKRSKVHFPATVRIDPAPMVQEPRPTYNNRKYQSTYPPPPSNTSANSVPQNAMHNNTRRDNMMFDPKNSNNMHNARRDNTMHDKKGEDLMHGPPKESDWQ